MIYSNKAGIILKPVNVSTGTHVWLYCIIELSSKNNSLERVLIQEENNLLQC